MSRRFFQNEVDHLSLAHIGKLDALESQYDKIIMGLRFHSNPFDNAIFSRSHCYFPPALTLNNLEFSKG